MKIMHIETQIGKIDNFRPQTGNERTPLQYRCTALRRERAEFSAFHDRNSCEILIKIKEIVIFFNCFKMCGKVIKSTS